MTCTRTNSSQSLIPWVFLLSKVASEPALEQCVFFTRQWRRPQRRNTREWSGEHRGAKNLLLLRKALFLKKTSPGYRFEQMIMKEEYLEVFCFLLVQSVDGCVIILFFHFTSCYVMFYHFISLYHGPGATKKKHSAKKHQCQLQLVQFCSFKAAILNGSLFFWGGRYVTAVPFYMTFGLQLL